MRLPHLIAVACLLGSAALPATAQPGSRSSYMHHNITVGGGSMVPGAALSGAFSPSGFLRISYGYRFLKNVQADTGIDIGFLSAGVKDFYQSQYGPLRIRDYEYMVPLGARVVLPFRDERIQLHAGGGGAYLRYSERSTQPFANAGIRLDCPVCNARSGWGTYGSAGASIAVTPGGHIRVGGTVNVYRATTDGQGVGTLQAGPTSDRWINAAIELKFAF